LCCSATKKATVATVPFFFLLWNCAVAQHNEKGDGSYHRLLLPLMELRCSTTQQRRRQPHRRLFLPLTELRCVAAQRKR
jgi:hypothetical protein